MMSFSSTKGIDNNIGEVHGSVYPLLKLQGSGSVICSVVSDSLQPHGLWPTRFLHWLIPFYQLLDTLSLFCHYFKQYSTFLVQSSVHVGLEKLKVKVLVTQSGLTLAGPMYCSPPGSSAHETFQARILEWVAIPSPGNIPHLGIEHRSPALQVTSLPSKPPGKPKTGVLGIYLELNFGRFLKSGFHFLIFSNIKVFPHRLQCHLVHIHSR